MTTFLIIYGLGYVFAYILLKIVVKYVDNNIWTKEKRLKSLYMSIFSWITVVAILLIVSNNPEDESASW